MGISAINQATPRTLLRPQQAPAKPEAPAAAGMASDSLKIRSTDKQVADLIKHARHFNDAQHPDVGAWYLKQAVKASITTDQALEVLKVAGDLGLPGQGSSSADYAETRTLPDDSFYYAPVRIQALQAALGHAKTYADLQNFEGVGGVNSAWNVEELRPATAAMFKRRLELANAPQDILDTLSLIDKERNADFGMDSIANFYKDQPLLDKKWVADKLGSAIAGLHSWNQATTASDIAKDYLRISTEVGEPDLAKRFQKLLAEADQKASAMQPGFFQRVFSYGRRFFDEQGMTIG